MAGKRVLRSQSAMEYLMTYGWVIVIIAAVLATLYQFGLFNPYTYAQKAPPGSCQVIRASGVGSVPTGLFGPCNSAMPQYVAFFNGNAIVYLGNSVVLRPSSLTIALWEDNLMTSTSWDQDMFAVRGNSYSNYGYSLTWGWGPTQMIFRMGDGANDQGVSKSGLSGYNNWKFVVGEYSGGTLNIYLNATLEDTLTGQNAIVYDSSQAMLGNAGSGYPFYGYLSNVQLYNASLSSNEISQLYTEGVGGDPVDINHLSGWWPLNGDAKDYSGNKQNGLPANVVFTSSWMQGYVAPS